jgi:hypothetical protein
MKNQRWPGDYETIPQEFANSRREEQMGMNAANMSHGNDFLAMGITRRLDAYETGELEPSWTTQLDTNGMQPHAREYLERDLTAMRSGMKYSMIAGQVIDHCEGIQFSGCP